VLSKTGAIAVVTVGLMWALSSVQSLVHERQARQQEAERNVANSLAGSQVVLGPALVMACSETWLKGYEMAGDHKPILETTPRIVRLPASQLSVDTTVGMTPRHRGIFKVNGYSARTQLQAQWADLSGLTPQPERERGKVTCGEPVVAMALSDARGIRVAEIKVNGVSASVLPGSALSRPSVGFHAALPAAALSGSGPMKIEVNLELAGTQSLSVVPIADSTSVKMAADWPHPAFGGRFLPSERHITDQGFDATWHVTSLASTAQQAWLNGATLCPALSQSEPIANGRYADTSEPGTQAEAQGDGACVETFGVTFVDPVNAHVLSDRATKYGLLFIALTFVGVGLVEVLKRLRVHPIQYLLVGAALAVFFLLLVSLSEHLAFGLAYLAAALACTLLLAFYGTFVLQGWRAGLGFGSGIAGLFATLYALLQMEQTALVLGSLALFLVLAVIMFATRRLNWYDLMAQVRGDPGRADRAPEAHAQGDAA
jgi:inner membrane protein